VNLDPPDNTKRTIILGRTGSGKSVGGLNLLASQNWDKQPWTILDFKGEDLVRKIWKNNERALKVISPDDAPPKKPGLYLMPLRPVLDDAALERWLMQVYSRANGQTKRGHGLFIDEGFAMPSNGVALDLIFTQGRSKKIPVIALYQRPVYMTRFAVAQADYFMVYSQNDRRDLRTTDEFVQAAILPNGQEVTPKTVLPPWHSLWYDVAQGKSVVLGPAPEPDAILAKFNRRLSPSRCRAYT
jgi:hypothetical protein